MPLSSLEVRVLGALIEKAATTPDAYPLSTQALVTACNQRTSRDPVTDYHLQEVQEALARLRDRALALTIQEVGDRVPKHSHRVGQALGVDDQELALLSVLMLRGEQTAGELRSRTERYVTFRDVAAVEAVLVSLANRRVPLVTNRGRAPGRKEDRWTHALGADEERLQPRARSRRAEDAPDGASDATAPPPLGSADLEARFAALEARIEALEAALLVNRSG
jgi:uncharacterized protein